MAFLFFSYKYKNVSTNLAGLPAPDEIFNTEGTEKAYGTLPT
jgi:hypothetical protein